MPMDIITLPLGPLLSAVPDEALFRILAHLNPHSLLSFALTCSKAASIIADQNLGAENESEKKKDKNKRNGNGNGIDNDRCISSLVDTPNNNNNNNNTNVSNRDTSMMSVTSSHTGPAHTCLTDPPADIALDNVSRTSDGSSSALLLPHPDTVKIFDSGMFWYLCGLLQYAEQHCDKHTYMRLHKISYKADLSHRIINHSFPKIFVGRGTSHDNESRDSWKITYPLTSVKPFTFVFDLDILPQTGLLLDVQHWNYYSSLLTKNEFGAVVSILINDRPILHKFTPNSFRIINTRLKIPTDYLHMGANFLSWVYHVESISWYCLKRIYIRSNNRLLEKPQAQWLLPQQLQQEQQQDREQGQEQQQQQQDQLLMLEMEQQPEDSIYFIA